jgi:hypothetical protein
MQAEGLTKWVREREKEKVGKIKTIKQRVSEQRGIERETEGEKEIEKGNEEVRKDKKKVKSGRHCSWREIRRYNRE